jgi:hypothetical protein
MQKTFNRVCAAVWLGAALGVSCENPAASGSPQTSPSISIEAGHNRLRVSWNRAGDADSYELWYRRSGDSPEQERLAGETGGDSMVIPNLETGVDYHVRLRPKNAQGTGPWSEAVTSAPSAVRNIPQNLGVTEGDGSLTLSWDTLWDAACYEVFYSAPNANPAILDKIKCAEEPEEGNITINLDDYLYRYRVWVRAKYDDGTTGGYGEPGEGKIYKLITTELYDMGYFLENPPPTVITNTYRDPYRIALTDFYAGSTELRKLAGYTKGKYVDLDMGGLTDLWVTVFASTPENRDKFVSIIFPRDIENIPDYCCGYMNYLLSVELPLGIKRIGDGAFIGASFRSITLPPEATEIGDDAFAYGSLREISFHPGTVIGINAFYNCDDLIKIDLTNVKSIGSGAFYQCGGLRAAIVNKDEPPAGNDWMFGYYASGLPDDFAIYVPDESVAVYENTPGWSSYYNGFGADRVGNRFKPLSELPEEYR